MNTIEFLEKCLCTKRGAGTMSEAIFVKWLIDVLPVTSVDMAGNLHCDLRIDNEKTLFTAHIDTCSRAITEMDNVVFSDGIRYSVKEDVLGADNGAGCAILYTLIQAKIPAYYIFTRGEECGGVGSTYLAENMPDLLKQFDRAIAFDRRGTCDIVHEMCVGETASIAFAESVSNALNALGMLYAPSRLGSFTDVANWIEFIPECINISVGYENEHSKKETLLIEHFNTLAKNVVLIDWENLPVVRKATTNFEDNYYNEAIHSDILQDFEQELYYSALDKYCTGETKHLLEMIAEYLFPEDIETGLKHINNNTNINSELIDNLYTVDKISGMEILLDALYY